MFEQMDTPRSSQRIGKPKTVCEGKSLSKSQNYSQKAGPLRQVLTTAHIKAYANRNTSKTASKNAPNKAVSPNTEVIDHLSSIIFLCCVTLISIALGSSEEDTETSDVNATPLPERPKIPLASSELDITINGKSVGGFVKRPLDLNVSYNDFLNRLDNIVATKRKLTLPIVQSSRKPICYFWLRGSQTNAKNLGKLNIIEDEESYLALQQTVSNTARSKSQLKNKVLRILIDLIVEEGEADGTEFNPEEYISPVAPYINDF